MMPIVDEWTFQDEGFVTPTTPDIPRSSTYHQAQKGDEQQTSVNSGTVR